MGGVVETYTNGVRCEMFSVENCNGKNMAETFGKIILKSMYGKYGVLFY